MICIIKRIPILVLILSMIGCSKKRIIHFYPDDKSQCITVIDDSNIRYVIDGKHNSVPKSNFIKLDMQDVDLLSNSVHICWKNDENLFNWYVVVDKSKIIQNKLNNKDFHLETSLPDDKDGIPTEVKFRQGKCMIFSYYLMKLSPNVEGLVEIVK